MGKRIIIIEDTDDVNGLFGGLISDIDDGNPCRNCSNNPANNPNASGFCNCVLPEMWRQGGTGGRRGRIVATSWTSTGMGLDLETAGKSPFD